MSFVCRSRRSPEVLFRIGRRPNPWEPQDWSRKHEDGTFGNRFDDPASEFRVLYASSQPIGCYIETLARYRISLELLAELSGIDGTDDFTQLGTLPAGWTDNRQIAMAIVEGTFADIYATASIQHLRPPLAALAFSLGYKEIDAAVLQSEDCRNLTQAASRIVYEESLNGIYYRSRYGHELENWAIFEPFNVDMFEPLDISVEWPEDAFTRALTILQIRV